MIDFRVMGRIIDISQVQLVVLLSTAQAQSHSSHLNSILIISYSSVAWKTKVCFAG